MTTTTELTTLTADDLAAWKVATGFSLHTGPNLDAGVSSVIRLYCRPIMPAPVIFTASQQRLFPGAGFLNESRIRELTVNASAYGYGATYADSGWSWNEFGGHKEPVPHCFISSNYDMKTWATIGRALRVGSVLSLRWSADNNTDTARDAGLHLDSVDIEAATGKNIDRWHIAWAACRDNSARMIQRQR